MCLTYSQVLYLVNKINCCICLYNSFCLLEKFVYTANLVGRKTPSQEQQIMVWSEF